MKYAHPIMLRCERGFAGVVCRVSKGASLAASPLQVVQPDGEHFVSSGSRQAISPPLRLLISLNQSKRCLFTMMRAEKRARG